MENVDVEAFGDAPGAAGVGELRNALVENAGGGERERAVDDVGMAGDPADVGHAPIYVLGMDVLDVLRRPRNVGKVATYGVLATFGPPRGAACVHEEKRRLGRHLHGLDTFATELPEDVVDDDAASLHEFRGTRVLARVALPDQNVVKLMTGAGGLHDRRVSLFLVIK